MMRAACTFAVLLLTATGARAERAPSEGELLGRLMAPCCWNQTLELHDSELASALRAELRGRLSRGETSQAIERDMVRRYGARMLAAPGQGDSRQHIVWITAVAMSLALLALVAAALRWRARAPDVRTATAAPQSSAADARFDAIIEADLESRSV